MFNKYYFTNEDNSEKAARIVNRGLEKLGGDLRSISQAEIEARDRVDITLKEYEKLKNDVAKYERRLADIGRLIIRLGIPAEEIEHIIPGSICVETINDPINLSTRYKITFYVDDTYKRG